MQLIQIKSATSKGYEVATEGDSINLSQPNSETRRGRVGKGKAQTLETSCNQAVVEPMVGAFRGRNPENPSDRTTGAPTEQRLEINKNGTTNTLTSVQKDNVVVEPKIIGYTRDAQGKVTDRHLKDEAGTIHSSSGGGGNTDQFVQDYRIRRLTPIECERLQGFPDNHTEYGNYDGEVKKMSNTQRYKQCGNAVTVDIVALVAEAVKPLFK